MSTKIAVLSDIHGNDLALSAVLQDAQEQGAEQYVVTGDLVSDFPYGSHVIHLLRNRNALIIRGNREEYILRCRENPADFSAPQFRPIVRAAAELSEEDAAYLSGLLETVCFSVEQLRFYAAHSLSLEQTETFPLEAADVFLCGHTHQADFQLLSGSRHFINAGSVGNSLLPRYTAEYLLLDIDGRNLHISHRKIPWDYGQMENRLMALPDGYDIDWYRMLMATAETGENWGVQMFDRYHAIRQQRNLPDGPIPLEIWDELMETMGFRKYLSRFSRNS